MITKTITIFQNYSQSELNEIHSKCLIANRHNEPYFRYNKHVLKTNDFLNAYQYLQCFEALQVKYEVSKNLLFNGKGNLNKPETIKDLCTGIAFKICRNIIEGKYSVPSQLSGYFPNAKYLHSCIMDFYETFGEREFPFNTFYNSIKFAFPQPITKQFARSLLRCYFEVEETANEGLKRVKIVSKIDTDTQVNELLTCKYYMPDVHFCTV